MVQVLASRGSLSAARASSYLETIHESTPSGEGTRITGPGLCGHACGMACVLYGRSIAMPEAFSVRRLHAA
ncbi:hypothetical protein Ssi02_12190 [Sinosporangium siamense]|uniref:Uncharacterized protein n=1 Tax=Sinosporangium siamense TaxID=1367973 RepID=A0A919RBS5_9ACTN|nr:hypothetical protein Ssi02_12190 [Sinosporangium siamense]